jgi:hypothetical protein
VSLFGAAFNRPAQPKTSGAGSVRSRTGWNQTTERKGPRVSDVSDSPRNEPVVGTLFEEWAVIEDPHHCQLGIVRHWL